MKQCPYCNKEFKTWMSIRGHVSHCINNTGEYFTDLNEGPIHYSKIKNLNSFQIKAKYPNLKANLSNVRKGFFRRGITVYCYRVNIWNKKTIIESIQLFYKENNRIPQTRDFLKSKGKYPGHNVVIKYFGSWNKGIEAAGFTPNIQNGWGINTIANDGITYRSRYEADFVNKFLHDKYIYEIEPSYPSPYCKWYDWYIPELNLYIELDGEIRPEIIKEKIEINKSLNRNLLVINTKNLINYDSLEEMIY